MAGGELIEAIAAGDAARLAALVEASPHSASQRDERGVSAVLHACYRRRPDLVEILLPRLAALDLPEAAAVGDTARVELLLAEHPEAVDGRSGDGFTALHYAAFFGSPEIAGLLIAAGANVSAVAANPTAVQPLHSAAATSQLAIAAALLAAGADPNARQQGGFVPLHAAAQNGDQLLVDLLLGHGADPALETDDGWTAAELASAAGHHLLAARRGRP